jgi:hypothetical protein
VLESASVWKSRLPAIVLALTAVVAIVTIAAATGLSSGLVSPATATPNGPATFVHETASGVESIYDGDWPFVVGGGVAILDCDHDGLPDLYVAGGERPATLYRNESEVGGPLRFAAVPGAATDMAGVTGAYPLDIDADGAVDLAVLRLGEEVILRGEGDCRFGGANEELGVFGHEGLTTAFSATWEGSNELPTLAFGNYAGIAPDGDWDQTCIDGQLIRPDPAGAAYATPTALSPTWCTLSMLFSDWDRSGRRDLRVSNDRHYYDDRGDGGEQLWRIEPGSPPRPYSQDEGWATLRLWGMGIASHDLTGDSFPEVYLTSQADNKLQTLAVGPDRPEYHDIALRSGVTAHIPFTGGETLPSTGWHDEFDDVNNDTFMDLFVAKGNVDEVPDYAMKDPSNLFLGQADGTFRESADVAGVLSYDRARGAGVADLNGDGMLDLVVVNRRAPAKVWRNVGTGSADAPMQIGRWIAVELSQPGPNRDAIGAWVTVRVGDRIVEREVTVGGGHASGQLGPIHFGLGTADRADVRVQWPDGEVGPWQPVDADRRVTIQRGGEPREWTPPEA